MPPPLVSQSTQCGQSILETALVQRQLGFGHQACRFDLFARSHCPPPPNRYLRGIAQRMGGTPADQAHHAALRVFRPGFLGLAHGMAVTPFDHQPGGLLNLIRGLLLCPLLTKRGDRIRQVQGMPRNQQGVVNDGKTHRQQKQEKVERQFNPPGRKHQQHIAVVVARHQGQSNGRCRQHQ